MKKFQNYIEYALFQTTAVIFRAMPNRMAIHFGAVLGLFIFYFIPIRKKIAIENISSSFPDKSKKEIKGIARKSYIHFSKNLVEFIRMKRMDWGFIKQHVTLINGEILRQAYDQGKGLICISGHFGNWELLGAAFRAYGFPVVGIARKMRNRLVDKIIREIRESKDLGVIDLGMAVRGIFRALRDNKFLAILADQDARKKGIFVDFLGRPSSTATGPAIFALKTGSPIIFTACVRGKKGTFTAYIQSIDFSDLHGVTEENIRILTQRHVRILESFIQRWPEQWFWMHRRWKTKPQPNIQ